MKGTKGLSEMKGKTRKASGGHRHPVETMAESEEFGSSGRIDTEIAASEDSCATKKRCISLSGNNNDRFGVPLRFYSLSKMSQSERKNFEMSLKGELEQIRCLRKKIVSKSSNCATISPATDGNRRQITVKSEKSVGISALPGKKRAPQTKISAVNRSAVPMNAPMSMLMKQCETLLSRLMQQHNCVFNSPVDVIQHGIPDYYNVIKHPMDLGTVKSKLSSGEYSSPLSFTEDVRLTYSNAMTYNPKGNYYYKIAEDSSKYFEVRWKHIEKKLHAIKSELALSKSSVSIETETAISMPQLIRSRSSVSVETETAKHLPRPLKSKSSRHIETKSAKPQVKPQVENMIKQEPPCKPTMTLIDRKKISTELAALVDELPETIINFLKESSSTENQAGVPDDELEIDFDTFSDDTCFQLKKLMDDYLATKEKKEAKAEQGVMQLHDELGISNSFLQPIKGNDLVEEDVDIGGNDMPISSFRPLEIEKDDTVKNTRCSSSSSSGGDSDSSSSDSDSDSESSGNEVDGGKSSIAANNAKETVDSEARIEQKKSNNTSTGTHGLNQRDQDCIEETDILRSEGERPASPDKLYDAAVLRKRFADTILKAQEKTTLGKVEKQDPEKLRRDREELERRRKEEKARLQAEAKAAEEARKKAEAEAVSEAKRKRELEREAARQALQKMEKTVDINENCQFMGDLEMLGVVPDENIVLNNDIIDGEETPDNFCQQLSTAGGGSFKFQRNSNPLQQLGLYMKDDYEDEEEEFNDAKNVSPPDDPEEGEID